MFLTLTGATASVFLIILLVSSHPRKGPVAIATSLLLTTFSSFATPAFQSKHQPKRPAGAVAGAKTRNSICDSNVAYDPITDWVAPPADVMERAKRERLDPLKFLTSPVFFSTDSAGRRHRGLSFIPSQDVRPLLFVSNHQLGGIDIWMLWPELLEKRSIAVRGLGHSAIFQSGENSFYMGGGPTSALNNDDRLEFSSGGNRIEDGLFQTFGTVQVTPRNFYRLMETSQAALHFPGGAREAFCAEEDKAYSLSSWPKQSDFVRTVAKFNGTIVPVSCVGALESADLLVDSSDVVKLPFGVGDRISNAPFTLHEDGDIVAPPIALPRPLPARHYYLFGKPVSTAAVDFRDKENCQKIYEDVKAEMRRGFRDLIHARDSDPFKNSVLRILYEQAWGKQAPTFPVRELNQANQDQN